MTQDKETSPFIYMAVIAPSVCKITFSVFLISEWPRAASTRQHAAATDQSYFHSHPKTAGKQGQVYDLFCLSSILMWPRGRQTFRSGFQVLASQCLTALCASAGGGDGCTVAEQPEIDVLLSGLLSSCFSVRDAALRVSQVC